MEKIKVRADTLSQIIQGIFAAQDVPIASLRENDTSSLWEGKTLIEALNIEYYTFKHRPISTETIIAEMFKEKGVTNTLAGLSRSFCAVSLLSSERLYSKDIDHVTVDGKLQFWIQTSKIKLLEWLIEECNLQLCGERISVTISGQERKAVIFFSNPTVIDLDTSSPFGESLFCEVAVSMVITPDITSHSDYIVELATDNGGGEISFFEIPVSSMSLAKNMTSKPVPYVNVQKSTGFINLSNVKAFNLTFYGFNTPPINSLATAALNEQSDNNKLYYLRLSRRGEQYIFNVVASDIKIQIDNGTGYEIFTVSFAIGGKQ